VIDGQWAIPGAQDTDTFVSVLRRLAAKQIGEQQAAAEAETCDGDAYDV
jgi:predicted DsbA family dithiol-disulfide isomerase